MIPFVDLQAQYRALKEDIDAAIAGVIGHGRFIMGPEVAGMEEELAAYSGTRHCVAVASGTEALLIGLMALGIGPGDEVIVPAFTFAATAEVVILAGAMPVLVDVEADTCNIDAAQVEAAVTARTRAIIPVGLYGQPPDMDEVNAIAARHGLTVIEDGAQSFGADYRGRRSCALSAIGCTSFFPSKPLGCYGDGGALFTDDDNLAATCREIRVHGQSGRYHHVRIGLGGRMDTLQCAVVLAKLKRFDWEVSRRREMAARYERMLEQRGIERVAQRADRTGTFAQYTILIDDRAAIVAALAEAGIPTAVHYPAPLSAQPAYRDRCVYGELPRSDAAARRVLSLPIHRLSRRRGAGPDRRRARRGGPLDLMADFVVIGAGIVGLAVARELKRREPGARVLVLEKEDRPGRHASGRNSGVLHSGIYYPAGSLKARLCGAGAREMAEYCAARGLPLRHLGKILLPTGPGDGAQLDLLASRAAANGVEVERLGPAELARREPEARSATGEALFVPATAVVSPAEIMAALAADAAGAGVELRCGGRLEAVDPGRRELIWSGERIGFGHAVNAAGLHADRVARLFGAGRRYTMLPFKGLYWKLDPASGIRINHLLYPVPDLRVPFLGIHSTTAIDGSIYLGPTAIPAFGRENYRGWQGVSAGETLRIGGLLARLLLTGRDGFRRLAWREGRRFSRRRFAAAARLLLPRLRAEHLLPCDKVGIRAQLLDRSAGRLVTDFLVESGPASTHVLNAVSPAFTSAFPLARHLCDRMLDMKDRHAT